MPVFSHQTKQKRRNIVSVQINLNKTKPHSLFSTINNTNFFLKRTGNHGTMEINHTSHIRTPSSGTLREFICAYTLYDHVQTSADIINH